MKRLLLALLFLLAFASLNFSQSTQTNNPPTAASGDSSNLLERVTLKFDVEAIPQPADIGFDNPKSSWKLEYELRLSDEKTVDGWQFGAYAACLKNTPGYQKCVAKANKKLNKKFKKSALLIIKGKFQNVPLLPASNREMSVPVNFTPEVINIFNRAAQSKENPIFLLHIKSKVSAKTSGKVKVKYKTEIGFQYPLKLQRKDGSFDYYNITSFGATVRIIKEDNKFTYGIFRS
jgi:hypothetical protein